MEMIDHKDRSWIIQLLNAGKTISEIQRLTGITRPTIYKVKRRYEELMKKVNDNPGDQQAVDDLNYFVENGFDRPKQTRQRVVFTPEIEEAMKQIIKEDEERLAQSVVIGPKHKIPGKIIFEILRDKHGYTGGVSTINHRVQAMRDDLKPQEGFAKQKWQPGYNMQYDFGNLILVVGGKKVRIHLAIGVLPFSGYIVCFAYYTEKMEVFVDSLTKMFEFFGGIPMTVTFDNMKNVVAKFVGKGGEKEYTTEIIRIANFYHFAILTTNPYSGWEKGVVLCRQIEPADKLTNNS